MSLRRLFTTTSLLAGLGLVAFAAERATFILTDGERISGAIVFHTEERTNIRADKQEFNVGLADGREMPIPFHQVAVIDFVGGTPATRELAALTDDGKHTLALREGTTRQGRLVDLIGGDHVRWQNADGRTEDIPVREVNRVYLDARSARIAFNYTGSGAGQGITPIDETFRTPSAGGFGRVSLSVEAQVRADRTWNDTGMNVTKGERIRFVTTGRIAFGPGPTETAGPDGNGAVRRANYPVPEVPVGALIFRVGTSGAAYPIGSNSQPIVMPATGQLMLAVNDDNYSDNDGAFRVTVSRVR